MSLENEDFSDEDQKLFAYIFFGVRKTPTRKISTNQTPPGEFPLRKFAPRNLPPGVFPPMFLNIPTRVF